MPRKIIPLKHTYPKDRRALSILAKSGAIDKDTFNKLQISNNRIKSYIDAALIKPVHVPSKNGIKTFYKLTDKRGKDFCRQHCGIKHFISNGPNSTLHNATVAENIAGLSRSEIETCLSERELQDNFISDRLQEYQINQPDRFDELLDSLKNRKISLPDVVFKSDKGVFEAIEVVTNNYKEAEINSKIETCQLLNVNLTLVHT